MRRTEMSRRQLLRAGGAAALALPAAGLLNGCTFTQPGTGEPTGSTLDRFKQQGYARIAIANEPPYTQINPDGSVTGAEPDVVAAVLKRMGVPRIEGIVTPYESMIPGLNASRWDIIAAGLFMKQSRCSQIRYSEPQIVSTESFAVPAGNPKRLTGVAAVKADPALKIAVLPGGFEDGALKTAGVPASQVVNIPDGRSGIEAVQAGRADAFFLPTLSLNALKTEGIEITGAITDVQQTGSGAGFRQADADVVAAYDEQLKALKATPEFDQILAKWGFSGDAVRSVNRDQLCSVAG
ncbi:ectoine/hydroxyectoine ABC transporter substrate-binding protein EhuB [Saccharopolyspora mangrovi]|uniref:Ectoine/hydroxyectoine ABC transporter substrate-binding protein EhuB n=1 Tax=Saccharopolyspora mangrovi TaxID=3082379 RepID=A0ABU6AAI4_9PSEU|nr:ectoine/hydroxyectoine ABC transporter substrate-binding protein EhuB [Saccharopolyspora sp. S2-29]MEB3368575.1 ectoine/hydroxyectoine ABC transporter substrate-binding protein EhuB [Saccharopolyspora sp. S2-29]